MSGVEIKSKTSGIEYKPRPPGHLETTATHLANLFLLDLILFFVCALLPSLPFLFILFRFFCCPLGGRIYGRHRNQSHFPFSFDFGIGWHRLPPPSWSILNCNAIRQTATSQMTANHRYTPSALTLISIISIHMQIWVLNFNCEYLKYFTTNSMEIHTNR
jgi:hypothetical protein